ncbi:MAG: response regulator [Chloroflexi bacterium]|nr:response regulator [Chloroflexota bacterium]
MSENTNIQVIIVDDVAETRENIRKLLQFDATIDVAGVADTGREGIELAKDVSPDVVLMDINMPDMDGIAATEIIREELPHVQIIILSVQGDPNYMRRAMLAGARDFLTKPPMVDELISAIQRAGKMAKDERQKMAARAYADTVARTATGELSKQATAYGKVVVVYSPKGGVGCTTVATNLAVMLHNDETPVVIVDANLQFGTVTVMLNERARNSIADLAQHADDLDPEIVDNVLVKHSATGIMILAAPARPEFADSVSGEQFGKVIEYLRRMYSYIIVDTSSYLSDVVVSAIDASSILILLATQNIPSINNARLFLDLAEMINLDREKVLFALNHHDKRIAITPEAVGDNLKQKIDIVLPHDERIVVPSVNRGIPFTLNDKKRPISRAIFELAEIVRKRFLEIDEARKV